MDHPVLSKMPKSNVEVVRMLNLEFEQNRMKTERSRAV